MTQNDIQLSCNLDPARPGQKIAIRQCLDNFHRKEKFTPIILPTRYGKSDVLRLASILGWAYGYISLAIIISPNTLLRNQIFSRRKFREMYQRYSLEVQGVKYRKITTYKDLERPTENGEMMLSITIQLAQNFDWLLLQLIDHMKYQTDKPVAVFIDETQQMSMENNWGELVNQCVAVGALIVPTTATPFRTDGEDIPGIKTVLEGSERISFSTAHPGSDKNKIKIYQWEADKEVRKLDLDWVKEKGVYVPFSVAWDENVLCHINDILFDVSLSSETLKELEGNGEFEEGDNIKLSELTPGYLRRHSVLSKITRDSQVILKGCELFYDSLMTKRKISPDIGGIIFVGNDYQSDNEVDAHAKKVKKILVEMDSTLEIIISTSSDESEGTTAIEAFAENDKGDVLIVKQRAGMGLDAPRAKVELDLSSVRTAQTFIQKVNRIATPHKELLVCDYIAPMDCLMVKLFQTFVTEEGGGTSYVLRNKEKINDYEIDKKPSEITLLTVDEALLGDISDSKGNVIEPDDYPATSTFIKAFPTLQKDLTLPEISQGIKNCGWIPIVPEEPEDVALSISLFQNDCTDLALEITRLLLAKRRQEMVKKYGRHDDKLFGEVIKGVWNEAKDMAGVSRQTKLKQITNLPRLKLLKRILGRAKVMLEEA